MHSYLYPYVQLLNTLVSPVFEVADLLQLGLQFRTELALVEDENLVADKYHFVFLRHSKHVAVLNA